MIRDQEYIFSKIQKMGQEMLNEADYQECLDNHSPYEAAKDMYRTIRNWVRFIDIPNQSEPDIEE